MKDVTGFRFETLTDDPAVRKAVDDMAYDLWGGGPQAAGGLHRPPWPGDRRAADVTTQNRRPVLRCALSNAAHPEYGQVTVPFPLSPPRSMSANSGTPGRHGTLGNPWNGTAGWTNWRAASPSSSAWRR
ncbi:MAG: hypothetical protein ACLRWQ_07880 [Flavonifractor plautii]